MPTNTQFLMQTFYMMISKKKTTSNLTKTTSKQKKNHKKIYKIYRKNLFYLHWKGFVFM